MNPYSKILFYIGFIGILILGVGLRCTELLNKNYLFGFDQGWNYEYAREIVDSHKFRLIGAEVSSGTGLSGIYHGPGYYYLLAIVDAVYHGDPYGSIVLMFALSIAALLVAFFLGVKLFGKWAGLVVFFLVGVSPAIATQARFLWTPHPTSLLIVLVFYFVYRSVKYSPCNFSLAVGIAALIYHFHLGIALPVIVSLVVFFFLEKKIRTLKVLALSAFGIVIVMLPSILFDLRHHFMQAGHILAYVRGLFAQSTNGTVPKVTSNLTTHLWNYWYNSLDSFAFNKLHLPFVIQAILLGIIFILAFYFLLRDTNKHRQSFIGYIFVLILSSWVFFMFMKNTIWDYYLIPLHFAVIILFSYVTSFIAYPKKIRGNILVLGYVVIFLLLSALGAWTRLMLDFSYDYHDLGGPAKIKGKEMALDYIYKDANNNSFNVLVFMPPIYTYPYDYLFGWYGKNVYHYVPGHQKKGLTYLLIEPDSDKPWSYQGWLETVIKDGQILSTVTLPTGHIVQKRLFPE
jgi:hypothetical protein